MVTWVPGEPCISTAIIRILVLVFFYVETLIFYQHFSVIFRLLHFFVRLRNQKNINIIHRTFVFVVSLIFLTSGWINFIIRFI